MRVFFSAGSQGMQQELHRGEKFLIARGEAGTLRVGEQTPDGVQTIEVGLRTISEVHARISLEEDGHVRVEDCGSTNGTYVRLVPGQPIEVSGDAELLLGRELKLNFSSSRWSPERMREVFALQKPEELLSFLSLRLKDLTRSVRLAPPVVGTPGSGVATEHLRLPLIDRDQLVVEWQEQTHHLEAESWLRAVVSLYNSQRVELASRSQPWDFTAVSAGRQQSLWLAQRVAASSCTVLLRGASGSGKEVLAHDLHNHSPRAARPFVAVNCGAIHANLAESVLFGHAKGSFTGANEAHTGLLEQADGGTLFLDEIGEMPPELQVKLLRALETRQVKPIGSKTERPVDIRVIVATHRPLEQMVKEKTFREDLFYRLSTIQIFIPPVEPADIAALARMFIGSLSDQRNVSLNETEVHELAILASRRSWPGGVRELRNTMERYLLLRDPDKSVAKNWEVTLAASAPNVTGAACPPPSPVAVKPPPPAASAGPAVPESMPLSICKHVDTLLFLSVLLHAIERDPRVGISQIAKRVGLTYQAVVNRLKALELQLDGNGTVQRIQARMQQEQERLQPYLPLLQRVFAAG